MRIGELSHRTGVSVRLLRYYEAQGLLRPVRTGNGYRAYGPDAPEVVARIRCLLGAGLSTATIAEVLPCLRADGSTIAPTCSDSRARIAAERDRVAAAITDLRRSHALLDGIVTAPRDGGPVTAAP
jgi:DNA-binding transcriptional MerR regulator